MQRQNSSTKTPPSADGQQHKTCAVCGQAYDAYDLEQYSHHTDKPHDPMASADASAE